MAERSNRRTGRSDEWHAKVRKVERLRRRVPRVSASALSAILDDVEQHGIPELHNRQQLGQAAAAAVNEDTDYGSMIVECEVVLKSGLRAHVLAVQPLAFLSHVCAIATGFSTFMLP